MQFALLLLSCLTAVLAAPRATSTAHPLLGRHPYVIDQHQQVLATGTSQTTARPHVIIPRAKTRPCTTRCIPGTHECLTSCYTPHPTPTPPSRHQQHGFASPLTTLSRCPPFHRVKTPNISPDAQGVDEMEGQKAIPDPLAAYAGLLAERYAAAHKVHSKLGYEEQIDHDVERDDESKVGHPASVDEVLSFCARALRIGDLLETMITGHPAKKRKRS
ncbi:hypothetical protein ANO11243_026670 [Dothideomycetidae sp. 11243]|nr:hypothetical protein ANO11243_026670 [fungal sp. No.11243]